MELVVGKKYHLRSGRIVRCLCTDAVGRTPVYFLREDTGEIVSSFAEGKQYKSDTIDQNDVVSEWKEPVFHYCNVYESDVYGSYWHPSKIKCKSSRNPGIPCLGILEMNMEDFTTTFEKS